MVQVLALGTSRKTHASCLSKSLQVFLNDGMPCIRQSNGHASKTKGKYFFFLKKQQMYVLPFCKPERTKATFVQVISSSEGFLQCESKPSIISPCSKEVQNPRCELKCENALIVPLQKSLIIILVWKKSKEALIASPN